MKSKSTTKPTPKNPVVKLPAPEPTSGERPPFFESNWKPRRLDDQLRAYGFRGEMVDVQIPIELEQLGTAAALAVGMTFADWLSDQVAEGARSALEYARDEADTFRKQLRKMRELE